MVDRYHQREAVRDADGSGHIKGCAEVGQVAYPTVDGTTIELNLSGLQDATPGCFPPFRHHGSHRA
jgi:hypothetical protein